MKVIGRTMLIVLAGFCLSGCGSTREEAEAEGFVRKMKREMEESRDPRFAVKKMRKFAVEKLEDITEEEERIIDTIDPRIGSNYDDSEYSFTWKVGDEDLIEVVTTPGLFMPIGVYRVKRVFYP